MLWKCCIQYVRKYGKLSGGYRIGKVQFSFQSQRRAMPEKVQTTTQFSLVAQLHLTLCNPMVCSMPGLPVHHQLLELVQTHVHRIGQLVTKNYHTIALISHASKTMIKILQARLQQYAKWELPDVKAGFKKAEEPKIKLPTSVGSLKKQESSRKTSTSALLTRPKSLIVDYNKLWKILKEMGIPDHLTCLLRNLYAGQEATVRTVHLTTDWFQIRKGVRQGYILSPLFDLYVEYIMWNDRLNEAQAGSKIARRNINNFRYADDTTPMAEGEEELKSLLMKVKEESEKVGLKLTIQKTKIMASSPITSLQTEGETMETVRDFIFLGSKITADGEFSHEIKRRLLLGRKVKTNVDSILKSRYITLLTKVRIV